MNEKEVRGIRRADKKKKDFGKSDKKYTYILTELAICGKIKFNMGIYI